MPFSASLVSGFRLDHQLKTGAAEETILTEMVEGRPLAEIDDMDFNDMIDQLGREVVSTRPRCATLALGTLKAAITQYRNNKIRADLDARPPGA